MSLPTRFLEKTRPSECIVWTGALNSRGYGCFSVGGVSQLAHRVAWEAVHGGPIPADLTVDHVVCANRRCVRVDHMELVSRSENTRRRHAAGEVCIHGHELTEENVYRTARGARECRTCRAERPLALATP